MANIFRKLGVSILILCLAACSNKMITNGNQAVMESKETPLVESDAIEVTNPTIEPEEVEEADLGLLMEVEVISLKRPSRIQASSFEYSGMAWYGEMLVLLPQYPAGKDNAGDGMLFAIEKEDLFKAIEDPEYELPVRDVPIINASLGDAVRGFEGFESILFVDQEVYLTIESHSGNPMMGYLIKGEVTGELESIALYPETLVELKPFTNVSNATFEAMTYWNSSLYILYEHNSSADGRTPTAYKFSQDLKLGGEIPFPELNFRVTDATDTDADGCFWVMNYFYPGDTHLAVDEDALMRMYGQGQTHTKQDTVERLVMLKIEEDEIVRVNQPPIYLQLLEADTARNWEGLVSLEGKGFLMITDSFPESILGFCPILR